MTNSQVRPPRKFVFENKEVQKAFLAKIEELYEVDLELGSAFGEAIRIAFAEKIASEEDLPTYYLTMKDLQRIASEVVDAQLVVTN